MPGQTGLVRHPNEITLHYRFPIHAVFNVEQDFRAFSLPSCTDTLASEDVHELVGRILTAIRPGNDHARMKTVRKLPLAGIPLLHCL